MKLLPLQYKTLINFIYVGLPCAVSGDIIGTLLAGDFGWSGSIDFNKEIYTESLRKFAKGATSPGN